MATYDARPSAFTQLSSTADWESLLSIVGAESGIDASVGSAMVPSLDTGGRNAVIADGNALIKGMLWRCDAPVSTSIPAASAQNRIDRLVLQLNRGATSSPTVIQPVVVTGTPSGSPVAPALVQTISGIFQIPVSQWTSTSAGALTGLIDQRQFSSSPVITMTSAYHPTPVPATPCIGIETDTGSLFFWNGTSWSVMGPSLSAMRTTDSAAVTGGTPAIDTVLQLPVAANAGYEFRLHVIFSGTIAGGFKMAFVPPAGATGFYGGSWDTGGGGTFVSSPSALTGSNTATIGVNGGLYSLRVSGSIRTTGAGIFAFYFSENGTSTGAILKAGSLLAMDRRV